MTQLSYSLSNGLDASLLRSSHFGAPTPKRPRRGRIAARLSRREARPTTPLLSPSPAPQQAAPRSRHVLGLFDSALLR